MSLNLKPYIQTIEEIEPGQTVRVNHTDCEAGEDTRRRLYLTRTHADETRVIGYCHNCQQGGYHTDGVYQTYRDQKHKSPSADKITLTDNVDEPPGLIASFSEFPADAQAWVIQRKLGQVELTEYGIKYDPSTHRIYIPRYDAVDRRCPSNGDLVGYQLRSLTGYDRPKYLTAQNKDAKNYTYIHPHSASPNYWAVIVEDMVSAIHIIKDCEDKGGVCPGVFINYGTRIDPTMMYTIAGNFTFCTVWLDNDNPHVINQAKLMERTIKMYSDSIKVARVEDYKDPKYHANDIVRILDEVKYG